MRDDAEESIRGEGEHRSMSERESDTGEAAEQPSPPDLTNRRRVGRVLVVFAAMVALFVSGWGMWTFFGHIVGPKNWHLILPMFLLFDTAGIACAVNARINRLDHGRMGIEGWLVWLFAGLSGAMSASDAAGREAAVRFAAPIVAAILFELLIRGERKDAEGSTDGPLDRIKRRVMARLGLLDSIGQSDEDAAKRAAAARLATLAYRMHQYDEGTPPRRRAEARFHRKLRTATERLSFAEDGDMIDLVRVHLAGLYQSVTGTARDAVADLNLWKAANHVLDEQTVSGQTTGQAKGGQASAPSTAPVPALTSAPSTPAQYATSAPVPALEASAPSTPAPALPPVPAPALTPAPDPAPEDVLTERYPTTEEGLIEMLRRAARAGDGTLAVRAAQRLLTAPGSDKQCGPERARRLLTAAGLYTPPEARVNGAQVPELVPGA